MKNNIVVTALVVSLLLNGALLFLWLRSRPVTSTAVTVAATVAPTQVTAAPAASSTATRPGPLVATRAATATASGSPVATTEPDRPTATTEPSPAPTDPPPPTPEPLPSPTIEAVGTDWLQYANLFRASAGVPPLLENTRWSLDASQHSRYMVYTGDLGHNEDPASAYYSAAGQIAGENGNIAAGYIGSDPYEWAINYWMSAPFHAVPLLDPQLAATGFAEYRDAAGPQPLAATMDVARGLVLLPDSVSFPIMYPGNGQRTWVLRYSLPEFPEALSTCPGYQQPTGAPIILQIGDGREVPRVSAVALYRDGEYLAHCWFDETTFTHPNEFRQRSARTILDQRDAIVVIPQQPLLPDSTYSVRVDVNGQVYTWSFHTVAAP